MADQINVNGNQLSWGSISARVNGIPYYGFTSISYADQRERVHAYGLGRHHAPRGRSRGKYTVEPVGLTGWKSSVQDLRQALASFSGGVTYGDTEFQLIVQYVDIADTPITVLLERCVWRKSSASDEEGPDPLSEDVEIDCLRIRRNGLVLYDNRQPF